MRASVWMGCLMLAAASGAIPTPASEIGDEPGEPLESGLEEQVEVQLVLLDALVLDRRDRTVPDLTIGELELRVAGEPVEIASLDVRCPVGEQEDARAVWGELPRETAGVAADSRIVLVFDYFHMRSPSEALSAATRALESRPATGAEHMVLSLGQVLRVEQPLTGDLDAVLATLERMRTDASLWAGHYGRLTEHRFFRRLEALLDLLERLPGRKAAVLFSGPFLRDGFFHDPAFRSLSAMSATSRTAVYPVDTGGLRTLLDPSNTRLGGPAMLHRLALETGGRMTADTNDLTLGYARARRDLGCLYTLGFYDRSPRLDRSRRVSVRVPGRRGLRVVHPSFYVLRSRDEKRKSLAATATMTPEMFGGEALRVDLRLLRPGSRRRWIAEIAVRARPAIDERSGERRVRAQLRNPAGTAIRSFERRVGAAQADAVVFGSFPVAPGAYSLSAVLSGPEAAEPWARRVEIVVPDVPDEGRAPRGPIELPVP